MHRTLRKCWAHVSWLLLSALSAATASSHPATDPRSLVSPVRTDFAPASVAAISGLEDVSPPSWSPDGHSILYLSNRSGLDNIWARQMARAIRGSGGTVDLKIFGELGHGTQEVDAYADENTLVVKFFDRYLRVGH